MFSFRIVIITGYADVETAVRTLKRGAFDFLEKPIEAEKLDAVLENCWNRWNVKNSGQSPQKIAAIFHEMSEREKGIVRLLVQELTSKQIGDRLGLSERTVQGHRLNLYKKFGVHTRDELLILLESDGRAFRLTRCERKILLFMLSFVIEAADRIRLELTDYGFGQESLGLIFGDQTWLSCR